MVKKRFVIPVNRQQKLDLSAITLSIVACVCLVITLLSYQFHVMSDKEKSMQLGNINGPQQRIGMENTMYYEGYLVIKQQNLSVYYIKNTSSMKPAMDEHSIALVASPTADTTIKVGDIITYVHGKDSIIHRVIDVDHDEEGVYYRCKGDNNVYQDPYKIRMSNITGIVVGLVY